MTNTDEFYNLVESMRTAQKRYFKTRDANYLEESRKLEKAVDKALAEHEEAKRGESLFAEEKSWQTTGVF